MTTRVLILGANGQLARSTTSVFLRRPDVQFTLYLRRAARLKNPDPARVRVVDGDVLDAARLQEAMQGQDVVYANLAGEMEAHARAIVNAMHGTGLRRLIFISSGPAPRFPAHRAIRDFPAFDLKPHRGNPCHATNLWVRTSRTASCC